MTKLSLAVSAAIVGSTAAFSLSMKAQTGPSSRRDVLQTTGAAVAAAVAAPAAAGAYAVPDLPYAYDALEPYIDAPTMKFHHDKHHATYVANINKATEGKDEVDILDLQLNALEAYIDAPTMKFHHDKHHATYVANINKATEGKDEVDILDLQLNALEAGPGVRNNGGGHYNHAFFWDEMAPPDKAKKSSISPALAAAIDKSFGSVDEMKAAFEARAAPGALFGSGWVWICVDGDALKLVGTANQDNPLMKGVADSVMFPILGLDVWEHAYYLKYQNRRPEYVSSWWNVVDWDKVSDNFAYVTEKKAGVPVRGA